MKKTLSASYFLLLSLILVSCITKINNEPISTVTLPTESVENYHNEILLVSGNDSIFSMRPDGTNRVEIITNMIREDSAPSFSPDGKSIIYGGLDGDIYLMDGSQTISKNLTNSSALDRTPIFSPDGNLIASVNNMNGVFGLYLMNRDGSNNQCLIDSPNDIIIGGWSPDSEKIVYVELIFPATAAEGVPIVPSYFLNTIDLESQEIHTLIQEGQDGISKPASPSFSPDAKKVVFQGIIQNNINIFTIDENNNINQITHDQTYNYTNPFWNPDGNQIAAFVSPIEKNNGDSFLGIIDLDGNLITRFNDIAGYVTSWIKLK